MKTGRNEPCPCGSQLKYKRCCLGKDPFDGKSFASNNLDPAILARVQAQFRNQQAAENVRQQQQGYGRGIISWEDPARGFRFVAVGKRVFYGRDWPIFPPFLLHYLKDVMGEPWAKFAKEENKHPIFRWLQKTQDYAIPKAGEPKVFTIELFGFMACWLNLAYALYLIEHHDELPESLVKRLRLHDSFMPAYLEAGRF